MLFFMLSLKMRSSNGGVLISEKMFYAAVKYKQGPGLKFFAISTPTSVNEVKPNIEDYSDSECASKVNEDFDASRYPQTIYHVQCTTKLEQTCHQATKVVHILRRTGTCKGKETCEYKSDVMNVQTVCVKVQPNGQPNMSRFLQTFLNQGITIQEEDMEPVQVTEVNWISKCRWDWVAHLDENRFPRVFQRAVCRNTHSECKLIYKDIVMFRKVIQHCYGAFCAYERYISREPVACVSTKSK